MKIHFPKKPKTKNEIIETLKQISTRDWDPHSGLMFSHAYEHGIKELWDLVHSVLVDFFDKTLLDFTVYPSVLYLERWIIGAVADLMNAGENATGSFSYGGTESIMLAVKAAREHFRETTGKRSGEIILPETGHPAFWKSAEYLDLKIRLVPVDRETFKVDVEKVKEAVSNDTVMIVGSAPNYPFGTVDDIEALSDIAVDAGKWLHVDACLGGFVLPFFEKLGVNVPIFDFRLPGVYSISADLHKYGYVPRGASVVLFKEAKLKLGQLYVNSKWPGYPLVNSAVLSTRSAGTLAASFVVLNYLGEEGYMRLAKEILEAKDKLIRGLNRMGYRVLGQPESSVLSFTHDDVNIFYVSKYLKGKGWYPQDQPGSKDLGYPKSIHLTISPIHNRLMDRFLSDLEEALDWAKNQPEFDIGKFASLLETGLDMGKIMEALGFKKGELPEDMIMVNELMHGFPPDLVEIVVKEIINELFKP